VLGRPGVLREAVPAAVAHRTGGRPRPAEGFGPKLSSGAAETREAARPGHGGRRARASRPWGLTRNRRVAQADRPEGWG